MRSKDYGADVLATAAGRRPKPPVPVEVAGEPGVVVEDAATDWVGAVVEMEKDTVTLEDRHGRRRTFPLAPGAFRHEGRVATLVRPVRAVGAAPKRTASGSLAVAGTAPRVAQASRILVEGVHDAALVERVWGDDLRIEGVVVELLDGVDALPLVVSEFRPTPTRRLGALVDHLVPGSKEQRIAAEVERGPWSAHVLITGHPFVDIWQAVKPRSVGIRAWPDVPRGVDWKTGVCAALGVGDPREMWRRVLGAVDSYADLEVPLLQAVERLVDFVTEPTTPGH
ncbi:MAG TPA: DUF3097 domain-containing protein [Frankiaceae bacterium]|nr:DUF3097 domain-containing protein [Frankiaceae bacterium]